MFVWISPARLRAKHWNIPVSSGRRPLICRLPPTNTLYLGIFTGLMGTASLYHTMSGCGVPAQEGEDYFFFSPPCHCDPFVPFMLFALSHMQQHTGKKKKKKKHSPRAWQGISTTFSISALMWVGGSLRNTGYSVSEEEKHSNAPLKQLTHVFFFWSLCPSRQQHELYYWSKRWQQNDLSTWSLACWCNIWII